MSVLHERAAVEALSGLSRFRDGFYDCLDGRADALFELADAAICTDGPVASLAQLSLGHCCVVPSLCASGHDHSNVRTGQMVIARSSKAMRSRWRPGTSVAIS